MTANPVTATFLVSAPDQPGLVARLAGFFYELGMNILDAGNFSDVHAQGGARFFMRLVADTTVLDTPGVMQRLGGSATRRALEQSFGSLAEGLSATWSVAWSDVPSRVAILVTREAGCLYDLLLRQRAGELACEVPLIISNRAALEEVADSFRIPFYCLPVTAETRADQERLVLELLRKHHVTLVVLARYMQVLSEELLEQCPPVINIHHGFLPAFQGAKPYHQAYERGVKIIGATAHYATKELDQGPIIEQDIARVGHHMGPEELARVGRDVERVVLARAVRAHLESRVIVEGRRTIVL